MALRWLPSFSAPLKWKSGRRSAARAARMFTNNSSRIAAGGTTSIGLSLFHEGIGGLTCLISACIGLHKWVPPSGRLTESAKKKRSRWEVTNSLFKVVVRQTIYRKSVSKGFIWEFTFVHRQNFTSAAGSIGSTALMLWSLWL